MMSQLRSAPPAEMCNLNIKTPTFLRIYAELKGRIPLNIQAMRAALSEVINTCSWLLPMVCGCESTQTAGK